MYNIKEIGFSLFRSIELKKKHLNCTLPILKFFMCVHITLNKNIKQFHSMFEHDGILQYRQQSSLCNISSNR